MNRKAFILVFEELYNDASMDINLAIFIQKCNGISAVYSSNSQNANNFIKAAKIPIYQVEDRSSDIWLVGIKDEDIKMFRVLFKLLLGFDLIKPKLEKK